VPGCWSVGRQLGCPPPASAASAASRPPNRRVAALTGTSVVVGARATGLQHTTNHDHVPTPVSTGGQSRPGLLVDLAVKLKLSSENERGIVGCCRSVHFEAEAMQLGDVDAESAFSGENAPDVLPAEKDRRSST